MDFTDVSDLQPDWRELVQIRPQRYLSYLKRSIRSVIEESTRYSSNDGEGDSMRIITDDSPSVNSLCFSIEEIFNHGLRDVAIFGTTKFWHYIENLDKCMPGTKEILKSVRDHSKTDIGRGRMFIRIALNESSLVDFINALRFNEEITSKYYFEYAVMRNEEYYSTFMMLLDTFANVHFRLFLKVKTIDQEDYWHGAALLPIDESDTPFSKVDEQVTKSASSDESGDKLEEEKENSAKLEKELLKKLEEEKKAEELKKQEEEKKAEEQRKLEELKKAEEQRKIEERIIEEQKKAEEQRKIEEEKIAQEKRRREEEEIQKQKEEEIRRLEEERIRREEELQRQQEELERQRREQERIAQELELKRQQDELERKKLEEERIAHEEELRRQKEELEKQKQEQERIAKELELKRIKEEQERKKQEEEELKKQQNIKEEQEKKLKEEEKRREELLRMEAQRQKVQSSSENEVSENEHDEYNSSDEEEEEEKLPDGVDGILPSLILSSLENTPLPAFWKQFTTSEGKKYYYNAKTRETIWYHPLIYLKKKEQNGEILGTSPITTEVATTPPRVVSPKISNKMQVPSNRPIWVPDNQVTHCVLCTEKFDVLTRKHHCRSCGLIFCAKCCSKKVLLPLLDYKKPEPVCNTCFEMFYSS